MVTLDVSSLQHDGITPAVSIIHPLVAGVPPITDPTKSLVVRIFSHDFTPANNGRIVTLPDQQQHKQ
ncbi:hypothetical protein RI054_43g152180 [Pseudoscourfieldia marina]